MVSPGKLCELLVLIFNFFSLILMVGISLIELMVLNLENAPQTAHQGRVRRGCSYQITGFYESCRFNHKLLEFTRAYNGLASIIMSETYNDSPGHNRA